MTAAELIEALKTCDPKADVFFADEGEVRAGGILRGFADDVRCLIPDHDDPEWPVVWLCS